MMQLINYILEASALRHNRNSNGDSNGIFIDPND